MSARRRRAPVRNAAVGERIAALRENAGLSHRELEQLLITENPGEPRAHVSARTIRRIEDDGVVPTARVKFALASAFGLTPSQLWRPAADVLMPAADGAPHGAVFVPAGYRMAVGV